MVKLSKSKNSSSGPSSSIGIMRFFDSGAKNPKLSPAFGLLVAGAFTVIVIIWHVI